MAQPDNRRKYKRYDTQVQIAFSILYDIKIKVQFQLIDQKDGHAIPPRYPAVSKNVSVGGLCFVSTKKLDIGDVIYLEVYLPGKPEPIAMTGDVRWSVPTHDPEHPNVFETGIFLITVGKVAVAETVYFDEEYHLDWSAVLESILGSLKELGQKRK